MTATAKEAKRKNSLKHLVELHRSKKDVNTLRICSIADFRYAMHFSCSLVNTRVFSLSLDFQCGAAFVFRFVENQINAFLGSGFERGACVCVCDTPAHALLILADYSALRTRPRMSRHRFVAGVFRALDFG